MLTRARANAAGENKRGGGAPARPFAARSLSGFVSSSDSTRAPWISCCTLNAHPLYSSALCAGAWNRELPGAMEGTCEDDNANADARLRVRGRRRCAAVRVSSVR